jgi:SSS family solute:Na+ symporter
MVVTMGVSLATAQNKSDAELKGLVYSLTPKPPAEDEPWYQKPITLGAIVLALTLALNLIFA